MVARIKRTQSLSRSLNYNEKKVQLGVAECIHAVNYPKDLEALNFYHKLHRLEHQAALNERVKANSVHVSLNFHESDKLNREKLCAIAESYMKGIGFEKQPYLVYQHHDAGHQHIHIVSTNIEKDGSKIEMNNIGRNQSENARKSIELKFGLTKAEGRNQKQENDLKVSAQKVQYGNAPTKRAITNVLDTVIDHFKYTSLAELNAILKLYNVMAERGKEDSKMYQKRGLVYSALDNKGNKIGTPIKASNFYSKPTLKYLEQKFVQNESLRHEYQHKIITAIKWVLVKKKQTLDEFKQDLSREGVNVVFRQNSRGNIYGITYVDLKNKCVFNGSDLGKEYSAKGILERLSMDQNHKELKLSQQQTSDVKEGIRMTPQDNAQDQAQSQENKNKQEMSKVLELLLRPELNDNHLPYELLKKKGKKRYQSKRL